MTINIHVKNQHITITGCTRKIIANSVNHVKAICTFDDEWADYSKNIIFTNGSVSKMLLIEDGVEFSIPYEVLIPGKLMISAIGYSEGGEKRLTTQRLIFPLTVYPSGDTVGSAPESYTPELWEQISSIIGSMSDLTIDAKTLVDAINHIINSNTSGEISSSDDTSGFYCTSVDSAYYIHDKESFEESQIVLKLSDNEICFSNDGGITYPYCFSIDNSIFESLSAAFNNHKNNYSNPHNVTLSQIGAAPSGYGLGTISKTLNGETEHVWANGSYQWSTGATDVPFDWAAMHVLNRNTETAVQLAYAIGKTNAQPIIRRLRLNNSVGEWEYFNPPMIKGAEYRTTEIWQGKPVYTKLIDFGALPNNTVKQIEHDITTTGILRAWGMTSTGTAIPYSTLVDNTSNTISLLADTAHIRISTNFNASESSASIALWYIKD